MGSHSCTILQKYKVLFYDILAVFNYYCMHKKVENIVWFIAYIGKILICAMQRIGFCTLLITRTAMYAAVGATSRHFTKFQFQAW